ncbi:MAG: ABC transporter ATP-binding protein [Paludibacteraceae bacterium]|jgi:lipoprotein-releasing system ATP-binding protein|nr:ABC transporter ATP-binding protein [Paludibacteraceae bacterium]MEE0911108.1 ABC transporter ATP-binding protein [Paludibacteraceae bacterium]
MIEAKNITKKFDSLTVLEGVNLKVEKGEFVSIVGASGAGKTTLLQILGSLDSPTEGDVIINDVSLFSLKEKELSEFRNKHIGFVFQFHQLLPEFTAVENIMIPALIAGRKSDEAKESAMELLQYLNLSERAKHKPNELSGGERQRVAVARALINRPDVLLADEPTGSLDSKNKEELNRLFLDLRSKFNQTLIVVTHDMEMASISDRVIKMQDGRIL